MQTVYFTNDIVCTLTFIDITCTLTYTDILSLERAFSKLSHPHIEIITSLFGDIDTSIWILNHTIPGTDRGM